MSALLSVVSNYCLPFYHLYLVPSKFATGGNRGIRKFDPSRQPFDFGQLRVSGINKYNFITS
jgi:hypothetical protein